MVKENESPTDKTKNLSIQWVKKNRKLLIKEYCAVDIYPKTKSPTTIFMAGSPGAGKTEFSVSLLDEFQEKFVRIDADEIREKMRDIGYTGKNSDLFQPATTKAVNILFDFANKKGGQNVLLDGTFAYQGWKDNVERSINNKRYVEIYYLHQDPLVAWNFVKERELKQGRAVPKSVFIDTYFKSIKNVQTAKELFRSFVKIYLVTNNYQKSVEKIEINVSDIENMLPKKYTIEELGKILDAR